MIPISILFFLLIIILILIICSIIVGSVQVEKISGGKNKYFGGDNDTLFTEIMGYLKLNHAKTSKAFNLFQIKNIINTAYKIKYNILDIFSQIDNKKIYLSYDNIDSVQREINNIIAAIYIDKNKKYIVEHAKALNDAMGTIDKLTNSPSAMYRDDINVGDAVSRSSSPSLKYPERSNSPSQSQYLHNSRIDRRQQPRQQPRHNGPLRGRSQNDNSSFDEELNMAETNAKNTESALSDIKNNLYSKINQDKTNWNELHEFVDNIHYTEY